MLYGICILVYTLHSSCVSGVRLYSGLSDSVIDNFTMLMASQFYDNDQNSDGQNDGLWCQSDRNQTAIGVWYSPSGSTLNLDSGFPLYYSNTAITGQAGLLRNGGLTGNEGIYWCIIADQNGNDQRLYVALHTDTQYISTSTILVTTPLSFQLLSDANADPPEFSLSFTTTTRPPTTVTCTVNGTHISISDVIRTVVRATVTYEIQVSVIIRMRAAGTYQCTCSNARIDNHADLSSVNTSTFITGKISLNF